MLALGAAIAAAALSCVRVDLAPGGIASARLDPSPRAVALGDLLRDSSGAPVAVRVVAYDAGGAVVTTAAPRYVYVPVVPDTVAGVPPDTALVVDSLTGAVRASVRTDGRWVAQTGRVAARVGGRIQLLDSLEIVAPPDSLGSTARTDTLRFDCSDDRTTVFQLGVGDTTAVPFFNTSRPFTLGVFGDSLGRQVGVRRWLVRWSIDAISSAASVSTLPPVPTVKLASGTTVPAIGIITSSVDRQVQYDTADASGVSTVRLRIQPTALGTSYSPDTLIRVTLRADVLGRAGQVVTGSPVQGVYAVLLSRRGVPAVPSSTCAQ